MPLEASRGIVLYIILSFLEYSTQNPYNGVMCNDTITATGVFSAQELWKYSKGKDRILENEALLFQPFFAN